MTEPSTRLRTIEVEPDDYSLIKPGELVDIIELSPLTLQDRRIYNLLILNAWESIIEPKEHLIRKNELRGSHNVNKRVDDSLKRLMGAVAEVKIERVGPDTGKSETFIRRVQLLGTTDEAIKSNGVVYYTFPANLRAIIKNSTQFARLQKEVMYSFSSKYALALYEIVQKRGNLKYKTSEEFPLEKFRALLGVEDGKLEQFKSFKQRAIDQAVLEVNGLGEYGCKIEPIYTGRKVTAVRLSWWAKNLDEKKAALTELRYSRVGRRARLTGAVEKVEPIKALPKASTHSNLLPSDSSRRLTEKEYTRIKSHFPELDIDMFEGEFREWIETKEPPDDYAAAFYGFIKRKIKSGS